jgi:hypothetical protein
MAFADNLLTGYKIGTSARGAYDERKKKEGMADAVGMVTDPEQQNEQQAMLEEQTLGFDDMDAQQWQPSTQDWVNIRKKGEARILESGGALEDVQAYNDYITNKQMKGLQDNSAAAADAMERGDLTNAARLIDNAYAYLPNGGFSQTANVDGQLMSFFKDEATGEMTEVPVPVTPDRLRLMAQAYSDPAAFSATAWDRKLAEGAADRDERRVANTEATGATTRDLNRIRTAREMEGEVGVSGGTGKGTGGEGGASYGWGKLSDRDRVLTAIDNKLSKANLGNPEFWDIGPNKQHLYGADYEDFMDNPQYSENLSSVQNYSSSFTEINPGITSERAIKAGEYFTELNNAGPDQRNEYLKNNGRPSAQSPTGFQIYVDNKWLNAPPELTPRAAVFEQAASQYAANNPQYVAGGGGGRMYMKKPRLDTSGIPLEESYGAKPRQGVPSAPPQAPAAPAVTTAPLKQPTPDKAPAAIKDPAPNWRQERATALDASQPQLPKAGGVPIAPTAPAPAPAQGLVPGESMGVPTEAPFTVMTDQLLAEVSKATGGSKLQIKARNRVREVLSEIREMRSFGGNATGNISEDDIKEWHNDLRNVKGPEVDRARAIIRKINAQIRASY